MSDDIDLHKYECAWSSRKHYLKEPIGLSCSHFVCKDCVPLSEKHRKCMFCDKPNTSKLKDAAESKPISEEIKKNIDKMTDVVGERFKEALQQLKSTVLMSKERIDLHVEYIKDEIDIRVESIKVELDKLSESLKEELMESKEDLVKELDEIDLKPFERDFSNLRNDIESKNELTELKFYNYQEEIKEMNKMIDYLNSSEFQVKYYISDSSITNDLIATIDRKLSFDEIKRRVKNEHHERQKIPIVTSPTDICVLPNGYLLTGNNSEMCLSLFDRQLRVVKTVHEIGGEVFGCMGLATDNENRIFISDADDNRVLSCDMDFNLIKSIGKQGNGIREFNYPYGLTYHNNVLYICDCDNNRIQTYTKDLEFIKGYKFSFKPSKIIINGSTACIRAGEPKTYFYYWPSFTLKHCHSSEFLGKYGGPITFFDSKFYEIFSFGFEDYNRHLYCYNQDGKLQEDIAIGGLNFEKRKEGGSFRIIKFNNKFLYVCGATQQMVLF